MQFYKKYNQEGKRKCGISTCPLLPLSVCKDGQCVKGFASRLRRPLTHFFFCIKPGVKELVLYQGSRPWRRYTHAGRSPCGDAQHIIMLRGVYAPQKCYKPRRGIILPVGRKNARRDIITPRRGIIMLSCVGGGANAEGVVLPPQTDDRIGI